MNNLVKLNLYGEMAEFVGYKEWEFEVKSVSEAINALDNATNNKFKEYFIKKNKLAAKYRILINGKDFYSTTNEISDKNIEKIFESELVMNKKDLKTIDIVPLIESESLKAGGFISAILGAILVIVGAFTLPYGGGYLVLAGIGLLASGAVALLSKPPKFEFNQNLDNDASQSYLFNGPTNTIGEGNPVPVGYGTMMVGSNVISAGYKITSYSAIG